MTVQLISEILTKHSSQIFDIPPRCINTTKIGIECFDCKSKNYTEIRNLKRMWSDVWRCIKCRNSHAMLDNPDRMAKHKALMTGTEHIAKCQSEEHRKKISAKTKEKWNDPEWRKRQEEYHKTEEYRNKLSIVSSNPEQIQRSYDAAHTPEAVAKLTAANKAKWTNPEYRRKMGEHTANRNRINWAIPEYRQKMFKMMDNIPKVSKIQAKLYSILSEMNIKFYREYNDKESDSECFIGYYWFDCMVPTSHKKILIEVNGRWVHSKPETITKDKSKATYIKRYHPECEIVYIWEEEFKDEAALRDKLKHLLAEEIK